MNPVSLGTDSRHQRRRLLALALLLVVSLTLGAALALQAIGTARRHRETAQRTLQDYAGFGAFILASQTYRQLGGEVVQIFTDWPASGTPAARARPAISAPWLVAVWTVPAPVPKIPLSTTTTTRFGGR